MLFASCNLGLFRYLSWLLLFFLFLHLLVVESSDWIKYIFDFLWFDLFREISDQFFEENGNSVGCLTFIQNTGDFLAEVDVVFLSIEWICADVEISEETFCNILIVDHLNFSSLGLFTKIAPLNLLNFLLLISLIGLEPLLEHFIVILALSSFLSASFLSWRCLNFLFFLLLLSFFIRVYSIFICEVFLFVVFIEILFKLLFILELLFYMAWH